jgi:hypothetical protein
MIYITKKSENNYHKNLEKKILFSKIQTTQICYCIAPKPLEHIF